MSQLWLDAGNTRIKWQLWSDEDFISSGALVHKGSAPDSLEFLINKSGEIDKNALEYVAISSVLNQNVMKEMKKVVKESLDLALESAQVEKHHMGFECAYEDVTRLGVDRWLAGLWAFKHYEAPVLVISSGSALTIDAVDGSGHHLGGYILPGFSMAKGALLGNTDSVRFENSASNLDSIHFGRDTASAVNNGILFQMKSLVERVWSDFVDEHPGENPKLVLTGGDGHLLGKIIDIGFDFQEDIVIKGLRLVMLNKNKD